MNPTSRAKPDSQAATTPRLAFILSQFPCVDEMFILREMAAMAAAGFDFDIYSIKRSRQQIVQSQARALLPHLIYRRFFFSRQVAGAVLATIFRQPVALLRATLICVRETWRSPRMLAKSIVLLPKAICYARLMQRRGVRHIHAYWATYPCTIAWVANQLAGIPYSFSAHAHDIYEDASMLERKLRGTEFVLTCVKANVGHLAGLVPAKRDAIVHIYHGLELENFYEDAENREAAGRLFRILSIGTLYKTKGFDTLIEACAMLQARGVPFQCKIVGDGPEQQRLGDLIAGKGLQTQVEMTGYLTQEQLRPLRRWADVFVLLPRPYLHWGLPNVYIESLASRLPVIATPLNAVGELVVDGETGLLVDSDAPEQAAQALEQLYRDPALRRRLAANGQQQVIQHFDARQTTREVVGLFSNIIGQQQLWQERRQAAVPGD